MAEPLKLSISRIWTQSWESLQELHSSSQLYGDLVIQIGDRQLDGVRMESQGGAELNVAVRYLMYFVDFEDRDSFTAAFQSMTSVEYEVERKGESIFIEPPKSRRAKKAEVLECSYSQVQAEIARFASKLRTLLVEHCPLDAAKYWWKLNLSGIAFEDVADGSSDAVPSPAPETLPSTLEVEVATPEESPTVDDTYRLLPIDDRRDEEFALLAARHGWSRVSDSRFERSWFDEKRRTAILLVRDAETDVRYLALKGQGAKAIWSELEGRRDLFYPCEIVLAAPFAAETAAESIRAIYRVGVTAPPESDPEYFEVLEAFCDHPNANVRLATLVAMAYPGWPSLDALAEFVMTTDPDPEVRAAAERFLIYDEQPDEASSTSS